MNNLPPTAIVALSRYFDRDQTHVQQARKDVTQGEYEVDVQLQLEGLLKIGEDYEQVKSTSVSAVKAMTYMVYALLQDDQLNCSKQKALALVTKALTSAVDPNSPVDEEHEKALAKELVSIRKRFTAAIGFRTQKGPSRFSGLAESISGQKIPGRERIG